MVLITKLGQLFPGNGKQYATLEQLNVLHRRFTGNKAVKRSYEIVFEGESVGDFFAFEGVIATDGTLAEEIKMFTGFTFCEQVFIFRKHNFFEAVLHG